MNYSLTNIADFERHFQEAELDFSRFENATVQNPDYVIFQIGENVIDEQISTPELENLFVERYSNVAKHFVSAKKLFAFLGGRMQKRICSLHKLRLTQMRIL